MAHQLERVQVDATGGLVVKNLQTVVPKQDIAAVTFIFRNEGTVAAFVVANAAETESAVRIVDDDQPTVVGPYDGGRMPFLRAPTGANVWITPLVDYTP
jgi:hypothetical protein